MYKKKYENMKYILKIKQLKYAKIYNIKLLI